MANQALTLYGGGVGGRSEGGEDGEDPPDGDWVVVVKQ